MPSRFPRSVIVPKGRSPRIGPPPLNDVVRRQMQSMPRRDTGAELALRHALHQLGLRYRVHLRTLPGTPDIALTRARIAIFVDGCFWHRCPDHGRRRTTPSGGLRSSTRTLPGIAAKTLNFGISGGLSCMSGSMRTPRPLQRIFMKFGWNVPVARRVKQRGTVIRETLVSGKGVRQCPDTWQA